MPKAGSQSHAWEKDQMGWMPWMPRGHSSFCRRFTPCHSTAPQHSDLQEHKHCPQPDEKHEITQNHWKSLKLKNLTSPPVHTKNKTTERSPTFAIFFKGKANTFWQYLQFRVQHLLSQHSGTKTHPHFIRLIAVLIRSFVITTEVWPLQCRDWSHVS